jgi:hypothetical protein
MYSLGLELFKKSAIVDHLICQVCKGVFRDPVVNEVGQTFCKLCTENADYKDLVFPSGNQVLAADMTQNLIVKKFIHSLEIKCPFSKDSCQWEGRVERLDDHLKTCAVVELKCKNKRCLKVMKISEMEAHLLECEKRPSECENCKQIQPLDLLSEHYLICAKVKIPCDNNCGKRVSREDQKKHLIENCSLRLSNCSFKDSGCLYQDVDKNHEDHHKVHVNHHLKIQGDQIIKQEIFFNKSLNNIIDLVLKNNSQNNAPNIEAFKKLLEDYKSEKKSKELLFDVAFNDEFIQVTDNSIFVKPDCPSVKNVVLMNRAIEHFERVTIKVKMLNFEEDPSRSFGVGVITEKVAKDFFSGNLIEESTVKTAFVNNKNSLFVKNTFEYSEQTSEIVFPISNNDLISFYSVPDNEFIIIENLTQKTKIEIPFATESVVLYPLFILDPNTEISIESFMNHRDK